MALKYVDQIDFKGKRVIARFDFNVPLSKDGTKKITDTTRIDSSMQTIRKILDGGASKLIMMSHLGRPDGVANPKYSLEPVAKYLAEKLGQDVILTESSIDDGIPTLLGLSTTKIVLLENLRFHPEEEENDREFARKLSTYADFYVNDAFGTAHRKHASTYEINAFFKNNSAGGYLLKTEVEALNKIAEPPQQHPYVAIVGGAKVSDKIKIIERLLVGVDQLLIGGAMAYPFLKASGKTVGTSLCSDEDVKLATKLLNSKQASKISLPVDHICSDSMEGNPQTVSAQSIPENLMGLDIGPRTVENYSSFISKAKTILWNGPMGLFENSNFDKGTFAIANALAKSKAFTLVGGGDSVSAINKSGVSDKISHISTGGGASLEYIELGSLPGINALKFGVE
jgi:phosphoglycerate kinase